MVVNGWNMAQNILSSLKKFVDLSSGLKDTSHRVNFERESLEVPESYIIKKVGGKGLDWCYIGGSRRKVAQVG